MDSDNIIYPAKIVTRFPPSNFKSEDTSLFESEWSREIGELKVVDIQNIRVGTSFDFYQGIKLNKKLTSLNPRYTKRSLKNQLYDFIQNTILSNTIHSQNTLIWIIDEWSSGYFHWMIDALQRLEVACQYLKGAHAVVPLPAHYENHSYIKETLEAFSVTPLYFKRNEIVQTSRMIFPTPILPSGNFYPEVLANLKIRLSNHFIKSNKSEQPWKRLYFSRNKANRRRILNESELLPLLNSFGFQLIHLELLSMQEKAMLCAQAECVISPNGAGLTNMLFMQKGTKVIEFRRRHDTLNNSYFSMCHELGIQYFYLSCDTSLNDEKNDIEVSHDALETLLKEYLNKDIRKPS